ncbi:CsbD family protein [Streptomyces sp. NPDC055189]
MNWVKATIRQVIGRKKETDGIVLGNERLRAEGQREKQRGRAEHQARHGTVHR